MATAEPEVLHTGNTPEKIAEYKIIYDYSQVGHHFQKEAEMWFGYHTRPRIKFQASEYHYWRKWNDPRYGYGTGKVYMVQLGKCPILVKATGELALSPTVLKQSYREDGETNIEAMFKRFRKVFADEMKPVVDVEAGVDVEPVVEPVIALVAGKEMRVGAAEELEEEIEAEVEAMAKLALMEKEKQKTS
jgi:hypothetical protein